MKKILIGVLIGIVVLVVVIGLGVRFFLDSAVKKGIETVGPMLTKVDVKLDSVSLSLLSGSGKIRGLLVGNPEGYKTPSAIQVGEASLALQPGSILSDKVVIHSVSVIGPEVTFETDLKGNNLSKILANLQTASGGGDTKNDKAAAKANKKLQVDDFLIQNAKLNVSVMGLGKSVSVPLPEIHLTGLGTGPEGITAADLTKKVIQAIEKEAVQASGSAVSGLAKDAAGLTKDAGKTAAQAAEKVGQGIGGLFKKK
jgi:uncharacterized protein involved in outer membrane biogenesis